MTKSFNKTGLLTLLFFGSIAGSPGCGNRDAASEKPATTITKGSAGELVDTAAAQPLSDKPVLPGNANDEEWFSDSESPPVAPPAGETNTRPADPLASAIRLELPGNLSADRLAEFLQLVDLDMQNIASGKAGIFDNAVATREMARIGQLKLQAATRLQSSPGATIAQRIMGIRGQLQALSHLAALGDLKAAQSLELLANDEINNEDPNIAEDSRLVLIGLELEGIQNGSVKNGDRVMTQVNQIGSGDAQPSIAALMVMGQAREVLQRYGYSAESARVRDRIVDLFANHPDPNVASMALQIAGTPKFAEVESLLRQLERGDTVDVKTWVAAVEALLAESPDLAAVQFIASATLQNEAAGRSEFIDATYDVLAQTKDFGPREQQTVDVAIAASKSRKSIVGTRPVLDLPSCDGDSLSLDQFAGKVVLMPFWSIEFPESLSLMQRLDQIRQQSPTRVEIVGVNMDTRDAPFEAFIKESPVAFRSFHSETKPEKQPSNPVAAEFGVVSMPFIVIVDTTGKVAAIDFTGREINQTVDRLLAANIEPAE